MNVRSTLSLLRFTLVAAALSSCRQTPTRTVTVEEAERLGRGAMALAREVPRERPYVAASAFSPPRLAVPERDEAITLLVQGREAAQKEQWPKALEAYERSQKLVWFDEAIRRERARAFANGVPPTPPPIAPASEAVPEPCAQGHDTVEALCTCLWLHDGGEHCLPVAPLCRYEAQQMPDASLFVLWMGRGEGAMVAGRRFVASRRNGRFEGVAALGLLPVGGEHDQDDVEVHTELARNDLDRTVFRIDVRQTTRRAGLVEAHHTTVKRTLYCVPPTLDEPARCPVDVVALRRVEVSSALVGQPPLPAPLAKRLAQSSRSPASIFVQTRTLLEAEGARTDLLDGKIEDLPPDTIGLHRWR